MMGNKPPAMKKFRKTRRPLRDGGQPSENIIRKAPAQDPKLTGALRDLRRGNLPNEAAAYKHRASNNFPAAA
jgi:hypothetical protein